MVMQRVEESWVVMAFSSSSTVPAQLWIIMQFTVFVFLHKKVMNTGH
jgi:hypothetical protein